MKIIIGLGNPGVKYRRHRHNIGFSIVERFSAEYGATLGKRAFESDIGEMRVGEEKVIVAKPQTYMNLSGDAVRAMIDFYKASLDDLVVVHDDLDRARGQLHFSRGSGGGGHNGVQSIIDELRTKDFVRLRIGIGRPSAGQDPADYVLSDFGRDELDIVAEVVEKAAAALGDFVRHGLTAVQQKYHTT